MNTRNGGRRPTITSRTASSTTLLDSLRMSDDEPEPNEPPSSPAGRNDGTSDIASQLRSSALSPDDSVSQVQPSRKRKRVANQVPVWDDDDRTDLEELDEDEKLLRRTRRGWTSGVYSYFEKARISKDSSGKVEKKKNSSGQWFAVWLYECKKCGEDVTRHSGINSTGNLNSHIKSCIDKEDLRPQQQNLQMARTGSTYTREKLRSSVVKWVTRCRRPFSIVNDQEFIDIIKMLHPRADIPSRITVSRDVKRLYMLSVPRVRQRLKNASGALHCALDVWSDNQMTAWLGIIIFMIWKGRLSRFALDFIRLRGKHEGSNLAEALYQCLCNYEIENRLLTFVADNASNNNTLAVALAEKIGASGLYKGPTHRLRCFAHVLNLVMQAFLRVFLRKKKRSRNLEEDEEEVEEEDPAWLQLAEKVNQFVDEDDEDEEEEDEEEDNGEKLTAMADPVEEARRRDDQAIVDEIEAELELDENDLILPALGLLERTQGCVLLSKAINLSKKIQNSGGNRDAFYDKCVESGVEPLQLIKVIVTRWNSHARCLLRLLKLRGPVTHLCLDKKFPHLEQYLLSGAEWAIITQLQEILLTFIAATNEIQKAAVSMVYQIIPFIDKFNGLFTDLIRNDKLHLSIRHAAKMGSKILDKYYTLTDESEVYRTAMLMNPKFKTYYFTSQKWPKEWIAEALRLARTAWGRYNVPEPMEAEPTAANDTPAPTTVSSVKSADIISFDMEIDYGIGDGVVEEDEDAFEVYLREPPRRDVHDPIAYWEQQKRANLNVKLAQFAVNHLSAPAVSTDPERFFSFTGGTITKLRNQLSDTSARSCVLVGQWGSEDGLLAVEELEQQLKDGWSRKGKSKETAAPEPEVIEIVDDE